MTDPVPTPAPPAPLPADKILQAVINFVTKSEADVQNALTQATAANNQITIPAWTALLAFMKQISAVSANVPVLHLATDIELVTEITQALQPGSPLVIAFAALAQYQRQSAANMVTGIVTGVLSVTKLLPIIPIP